jgi:glucosylceramidase
LPIESVAVQNEPGTLTHYPSCDWTAPQYLTFIKKHLGPLFRSEGLVDAIMLGTFNQPALVSHALTVLTDPEARQFVSLAGMQWFALTVVDQIRRAAPGLTIWQTETDCGNWFWMPGHDPNKPQNDIGYAGYTWDKIRDWLRAGVSVYELWNMVLDSFGMNIDSRKPWPQNCPITVDAKTRKVRHTPMFGAVGSFSRYVPPGSSMVETEGSFTDALAFLDPAGRIVVVLHNRKIEAVRISIRVRGVVYGVDMPARSFATLVVDAR